MVAMKEEVILEAIIQANRLGTAGIQVVGYAESQTAAQDERLMLITRPVEVGTAADDIR